MTNRVCAIIVTYNRRELLRESLNALLNQDRQVDKLLVIDNASTDGTPELLSGEFPNVETLRLPYNSGGAGGFYQGIKWAHENGYDWFWIMDDDSITQPDSLQALLDSHKAYAESDHQPLILASKVVWTNGALHPVNTPKIDTRYAEHLFEGAEHSVLPIRHASFVSILVHSSAVDTFGLPIAEYFIWGDDVEYTARILRSNLGVWVPKSVVCHKTQEARVGMLDPRSPKYYYSIRNKLWMLLFSRAWSMSERMEIAGLTIRIIGTLLVKSRCNLSALGTIAKALRDGFFKRPAH